MGVAVVADGRARGRRRARVGRAHRRRRRARREGLHLDARQGPRAVRARRPRRAGRPARRRQIRNADGVRAKFGVDAGADPRLPRARRRRGRRLSRAFAGIGARDGGAALNRHGADRGRFPPDVLGDQRELALLFKDLATLRTDAPLFDDVDELRWRGPTDTFAAFAERAGDARIVARCTSAPLAGRRRCPVNSTLPFLPRL